MSTSQVSDSQQSCNCACDWETESQKSGCRLAVYLRDLEARVKSTEKQLEELKEVQGKQVAFGVCLGQSGPHESTVNDVTLIYKKVYYNTGHYDTSTGIFTAPIKGVYYFSFSGRHQPDGPMCLRLMINEGPVLSMFSQKAGNRCEAVTNGMVLPLKEGDRVYIILRANTCIFGDAKNPITFIGHLLFPDLVV